MIFLCEFLSAPFIGQKASVLSIVSVIHPEGLSASFNTLWNRLLSCWHVEDAKCKRVCAGGAFLDFISLPSAFGIDDSVTHRKTSMQVNRDTQTGWTECLLMFESVICLFSCTQSFQQLDVPKRCQLLAKSIRKR